MLGIRPGNWAFSPSLLRLLARGFRLGLILGRKAGLACVELGFCRLFAVFVLDTESALFVPTGPVGDCIAPIWGLGPTEPDCGRSDDAGTGV